MIVRTWSAAPSKLTTVQQAHFDVYMAFKHCTPSEMYWHIIEALGEKVEVREMSLEQCRTVLEFMSQKEEGVA